MRRRGRTATRDEPPTPEPVADVARLVRDELRRQADAEAEARRVAEVRRFEGGPCWVCGCTSAEQVDGGSAPDPAPRADWHTDAHGPVCGGCVDLRGTDIDEVFLDLIAATLAEYGLNALADPNLRRFKIEPGAAERLGVTFWRDSSAPPGERFGHLRAVVDRLRDEALERQAWVAAHGEGPRFDEMVLAGVGLGPPPDVGPPQVGDITYPPPPDDAERRAELNRLARERWS